MVISMLGNSSYKKGYNFLEEDYKSRITNYFNPYGYDLEGSKNNEVSSDKLAMKTKNHENRKLKKTN